LVKEQEGGEEREMKMMLNDGKFEPIRDRDAQRIEEIIKFLYDGGVIISEGRKPAAREALIMTYELGFKRGFRAAKEEDMPWYDWEEEKKEK
jgi:hypothetical protein